MTMQIQYCSKILFLGSPSMRQALPTCIKDALRSDIAYGIPMSSIPYNA